MDSNAAGPPASGSSASGADPHRTERGPVETVNRRMILKHAVGLAAVGTAGAVVLEAMASPASASTTADPGAVAPAVVALADAPVIVMDASLGNDFRVTIAANRTMGNPSNPVDGQKIVIEVTQGAGGPFTLTWGSSYEFSTGLPQPALSKTAGQTDLLAFIYNAAKGKWLLAAFVGGFGAPTIVQSSGTYRLFPTASGPTAAASYNGPFLAGVLFEVTAGATWLEGYWWWVCPSGQSTAAQKFALWQVYGTRVGSLVAATTVTSGPLVPGQWNYVPLTTPVPLAPGVTYVASTGLNNGFPDTNNQFGAGDPYSAGIVNGPLSAYSDLGGSLPATVGMNQGLFSTAGSDPSVNMPVDGWASANFWMDLQVGTTPPAGTSYRLWPSLPTVPGAILSDSLGYTLATEFQLLQSSTLNNIWFYSPTAAGALPTRCAIWDVASATEVSGTDNSSPTWSGPAGSGWVACAYSGVTLPPGDYKVAVFYAGGANWLQVTTHYWGTGGPGASGITAGPLTAPSLSAATSPGQSTYNQGSWTYPTAYASSSDGENYWVDIEVTPA